MTTFKEILAFYCEYMNWDAPTYNTFESMLEEEHAPWKCVLVISTGLVAMSQYNYETKEVAEEVAACSALEKISNRDYCRTVAKQMKERGERGTVPVAKKVAQLSTPLKVIYRTKVVHVTKEAFVAHLPSEHKMTVNGDWTKVLSVGDEVRLEMNN